MRTRAQHLFEAGIIAILRVHCGTALLLLFVLSAVPSSARAQSVTIAVAASVKPVMDQLAAEFKAKDSIAVEVLPGASGTLAAQILHGAPYDIFLSADTAFPRQVALGGEGIGEMKILMYGALVFYARAPFDSADWRKVIVADSTAKIAIANPLAAPYGAAAVQALKYNSLYERVQGRFVQGESISQVNGFLTSGAAPMGFTAKANVISGPLSQRGSWVEIDHSSYSPLAHGLLLLRHSSGNSGAVQKFMDFLFSRDALEVLARFGYTVR